MSFGLTATLLVRLDAHMGTWVNVDALVDHTATSRHVVLAELEQLVSNNQVRADRHPYTGEIQRAMCQPGMSFGLTATLLVRLDAHMGTWVNVDALVDHTATSRHVVLAELEQLVSNNQVRADRHPYTGEIQRAMCQPGNGL